MKKLFIPESRKRPIAESLLYKQIVRFLQYEKLEDKFDIAFISITDGVLEAKESDGFDYGVSKVALPPKKFQSGRSWITKEVKQEMAKEIVEYLKKTRHIYGRRMAYVRGSYLEAVRMANEELRMRNPELMIKEIFTEDELAELKKRGIMWMKVGLRMPEAFEIFKKRMVEFSQEENKQLTLF